jgi:D-tyrosyl-tRNA(Tyr) deacylase
VITLVQRVRWARVIVEQADVGSIEHGVLLFVGVEQRDTEADADATARKIANMRLFAGARRWTCVLQEVGGGCLVVSQFTLAAELRHGNRPDFGAAAGPALAEPLYERVRERTRCHRPHRQKGALRRLDAGRAVQRRPGQPRAHGARRQGRTAQRPCELDSGPRCTSSSSPPTRTSTTTASCAP